MDRDPRLHQGGHKGKDGGGKGLGKGAHITKTKKKETDPKAAAIAQRGQTPCKFFGTPGGCRRGAKCHFLHATNDGGKGKKGDGKGGGKGKGDGVQGSSI